MECEMFLCSCLLLFLLSETYNLWSLKSCRLAVMKCVALCSSMFAMSSDRDSRLHSSSHISATCSLFNCSDFCCSLFFFHIIFVFLLLHVHFTELLCLNFGFCMQCNVLSWGFVFGWILCTLFWLVLKQTK